VSMCVGVSVCVGVSKTTNELPIHSVSMCVGGVCVYVCWCVKDDQRVANCRVWWSLCLCVLVCLCLLVCLCVCQRRPTVGDLCVYVCLCVKDDQQLVCCVYVCWCVVSMWVCVSKTTNELAFVNSLTQKVWVELMVFDTQTHTDTCRHTHTYTHTHIHTYTHAHAHTHTHTRPHALLGRGGSS